MEADNEKAPYTSVMVWEFLVLVHGFAKCKNAGGEV